MTEEQANETTETTAAETGSGGVAVQTPEFSAMQETPGALGPARSLGSVFDVSVTVTAELGRISMPIADLLHLGEGSVIELNRPVSTPIDIRAQGVLLARGEVVVVDDCFAVRLKEVTAPQNGGGDGDADD